MSNLRLGIVGAGYIAKKHLEVIAKIRGLKVTSITSRTCEKAKVLAKKYNINQVYVDIKNMINEDKPDALLILVSAENIFRITQQIIPYKVPFFIEKPPGLSLSEIKKLSLQSSKHKVINMVGFNRRFYSNFILGKNIIKRHGKLLGITIEGHERFWKIENLISKKNKDFWIYSNSSHVIDLFRFFGGEINSLKSFTKNNYNKNPDQFSSIIKFKNGIIGNFIANWYSPSGWSIVLHGEKVMVEFKPLEEGFWVDQKFVKHKIKNNMKDKKYKPGFYMQMLAFKKLLITKKIIWPAQNLKSSLKTYELIKSINNDK